MSKMTIKCLFGQTRESYPEEYAPELICAIDEWVLDANPDHWEKIKKEALKDDYDKNFISLKEIDISVDQTMIRSILLDSSKVNGEVIRL